jgi:exopolyphosphatase/guanosine-5'-triphosphate,3'-diphosphate pyrophosphatase
MRQAVIDIGTNTCLLFIAESNVPGKMAILADVHAIARLGAGVDKSKHIQPESYERLKKILLEHKKVIEENKTDATLAVATSAMRDAENRDEIIQKIKTDTGIETELLSGDDESLWGYRGAMCGLSSEEMRGKIGALDIGGGSTELSIGENGKFVRGKSIDIGAVRIKERFLSPINSSSIKGARKFIRSEIEKEFKNNSDINKLIAVAGTPTALAAIKLKLQTFDAMRVNGTVISREELQNINKEILTLPPEEIIRKYPAVHSSRADILPAGAIILEEILDYLKLKEIRVSTCGLRYGIMIREFEGDLNKKSDEWLIE